MGSTNWQRRIYHQVRGKNVMKTSELMLGDYLYVWPSNMVIKVAAIHRRKVGYHVRTDKLAWIRVDLLRPIPLTKDILAKIGFEPYIAGQMLWNKSEDFIVTVLSDLSIYPNSEHRCLVGIRNGYTDAKIALDYLHELQNALRICGINEEIET